MASRRLGEILISAGIVTSSVWDDVSRVESSTGRSAVLALLERGASGDRIARAIQAAGVALHPPMQLVGLPEGLVQRIPAPVAVRWVALPVASQGDRLTVVLADPFEPLALQVLSEISGARVEVGVTDPRRLAEALDRYHGSQLAIRLGAAAADFPVPPAPPPGLDPVPASLRESSASGSMVDLEVLEPAGGELAELFGAPPVAEPPSPDEAGAIPLTRRRDEIAVTSVEASEETTPLFIPKKKAVLVAEEAPAPAPAPPPPPGGLRAPPPPPTWSAAGPLSPPVPETPAPEPIPEPVPEPIPEPVPEPPRLAPLPPAPTPVAPQEVAMPLARLAPGLPPEATGPAVDAPAPRIELPRPVEGPDLKEDFDFAITRLRTGEDRDEVGEAAILFLARCFPRAAIFTRRGRTLAGWLAGGDLQPGQLEVLKIEAAQPSLLWEVIETRRPFIGPPPTKTRETLTELMVTPPRHLAVFPVDVGEKTVALLYGDTIDERPVLVRRDLLERLAEELGDAFARLILQAKLGV
ncbi:MAG: hypothetical protein P1V51_10595 [Deltaproteobacteria bacterium]|nr:hypothetical protein [Deltaproteobacteria bacterium]